MARKNVKKSMKGIELPVNVLVIIAIAVIVLLGLIVVFSFAIGGASPIQIMLEKGPACQKYGAPNNCGGTSYKAADIAVKIDANANGNMDDDTIATLCIADKGCKTDPFDENELKKWCGCKITAK